MSTGELPPQSVGVCGGAKFTVDHNHDNNNTNNNRKRMKGERRGEKRRGEEREERRRQEDNGRKCDFWSTFGFPKLPWDLLETSWGALWPSWVPLLSLLGVYWALQGSFGGSPGCSW